MTNSTHIADFWAAFLAERSEEPAKDLEFYEAFTFGSQPEMATYLANLVLNGVKTTTSTLMQEYEESDLRPPQPGDLSIVLDGTGEPVCIVQTIEVIVMPFNQVEDQFAHDYGEGDRTLEWWRENLWDYYVDECASRGWTADPEMSLLCERFQVVYKPQATRSHQ